MDPIVTFEDLGLSLRLARIIGTGAPAGGFGGGWGLNAAGDINDDGFDDYWVTENIDGVHRTWILYGSDFERNLDRYLADLPGPVIDEVDAGDGLGGAAAGGGNVTNNGSTAFILAAPYADPEGNADTPVTPEAGVAYLFIESEDPPPGGTVTPDGTQVVAIHGVDEYDHAGWSVAFCDVDQNGLDDMLIGAIGVDDNGNDCGATYIIYNSGAPFPVSIDLTDLDGGTGGRIDGVAAGDQCGWSVANLGDIDGDGFDDCAWTAPNADPDGRTNAGEVYVLLSSAGNIFDTGSTTRSTGAPTALLGPLASGTFDVDDLDGSNGFRIVGASANSYAGRSISAAGDVNGDGFGDFIIGADGVDLDGPGGYSYQGAAYVVFGTDAGFAATLDLGDLDGSNGFRLRGAANGSTAQTGYAVSSAGDFNGDGFDDLLIGAPRARATQFGQPFGAVYVVFGSAAPFAADLDLTTLDGQNGFRINAEAALDYLGSTVTSLGDVDGDGFDDIGIAGFATDAVYIVYGAETVPEPILGTSGDDTLMGGAGNDTIDGGAGADEMTGGLGDDTYHVDDAGDVVVENPGEGTDTVLTTLASYTLGANVERLAYTGAGAFAGNGNGLANRISGGTGNDVLAGGANADVLIGGAGNDGLDGGAGTDTADYSTAGAGVTVRLDRLSAQNTLGAGIDTLANIERLTGSAFGDRLVGNALVNRLDGGDGDDVLNGLAGDDTMRGGAGDDTYSVDAAGDAVIELGGEGTDLVRSGIDYTLTANVEILTLVGGARVGTGNQLDNTIFGSGGLDTLSGLAGDDILRGNDGRDALLGGDGEDLLDGGVGKDTMTGGAQRDVFQFRNGDFGASRPLADVITDFSQADNEKISLNLVDSNTTAGGNQAFAWIGNGAFTGVAGQLHYVQAGGNTYVEGDHDGDGVADIFITLTGTIDLVAGDFVL